MSDDYSLMPVEVEGGCLTPLHWPQWLVALWKAKRP
jgi:hypothetical protein